MTKELIQDAIDKAERLQSNLQPECFDVGGFTSPKVRHLMNNLGALATNYLECGTHRGALSVATLYGNKLSATLVDNWSEFSESDAKEDFLKNYNRFILNQNKAKIYERDCFTMEPHEIDPVDLYLYDANHSREAQTMALSYFESFMKDPFIFVVDDFNWDDVRVGTDLGLQITGLQVIEQWDLNAPGVDGYWNGLGVFLLKKP